MKFDQSDGPISPVWNYFGYDEPNYTYAPNGRKLLRELAALDAAPAYVRVHNLFTTGDGSGSLKWGSTNVYSEDASGRPIYSWVILDQIFDTFRAAGVKPLVEIGFMPKALSTNPEPYRHEFPSVPVSDIYTGWAAHGRAGVAGVDSGAVSLDPSGADAYRALGTTTPKNAARDVRGLLVHRELGRKRAGGKLR